MAVTHRAHLHRLNLWRQITAFISHGAADAINMKLCVEGGMTTAAYYIVSYRWSVLDDDINPRRIRHSRWKLNQELKWKIFYTEHTCKNGYS